MLVVGRCQDIAKLWWPYIKIMIPFLFEMAKHKKENSKFASENSGTRNYIIFYMHSAAYRIMYQTEYTWLTVDINL